MEVTQVVRVDERSQAGDARRAALSLARRVGLDEHEIGRLGLIVTEAATNLVKHAKHGEIVLAASRNGEGPAMHILVMDQGPGIRSLEDSLRDGVSSAGTLGGGLGAIRRTSSEFDIYTGATGTVLYSLIAGETAERRGVLAGAICAPHPEESVSGDAFAIHCEPSVTTLLVVDGLGHGPGAAEAAEAALASFHSHPGDFPASMMGRIHDALRPTRGAAAAVVRLDRGQRSLRFCGIGNISGVLLPEDGDSRHMVSDHGIVGHTLREPREFQYPLPPRSSVVLHSDGINSRWKLESYPGLLRKHPMISAGILYRDFRRPNDDATVVVLREAA